MLPSDHGGSASVHGHALGHDTYARHHPEQTLLYQLIEKHYPALVEQLDTQGRSLPVEPSGRRGIATAGRAMYRQRRFRLFV